MVIPSRSLLRPADAVSFRGVNPSARKLVWLLRAVGCLDLLALLAVAMPSEWHVQAHASLGLGAMPDSPIVVYLARSASALYAVYGALLLFLSTDVVRHRPVIRFLAWAAQAHALVLVGIDWFAGLPLWWLLAEGVGYAGWAALALWWSRDLAATEPHPSAPGSGEQGAVS